jgi:monoamine oxidase
VQHLSTIFGVDLRDRLVDAHLVDWQADPSAGMGYSYTPVNGTGLRQKLGQPIENRLFFAGEATSVLRPATVHGALETGIAAAQALLASMPALAQLS